MIKENLEFAQKKLGYPWAIAKPSLRLDISQIIERNEISGKGERIRNSRIKMIAVTKIPSELEIKLSLPNVESNLKFTCQLKPQKL